MASGKTHDFFNISLLPAFAVFLHPENLFSFIFGYLVGTIWLTPDLDLPQSRPFQRWGYLSILWIPYTKLFKHRSIFTHLPILGLMIRLFYLGIIFAALYYGILALLLIVDEVLDTKITPIIYTTIQNYLNSGSRFLDIHDFILGLFIADTLHIFLDYSLTYFNKVKKFVSGRGITLKKG
jgi:uncharacterized metal-binding protein